jgi:hypothetical protein
MVHFDLFSQKICTLCKFFVKKDGFFRPAGGGISYRVNDRVSRVNDRSYAVTDLEAHFASSRAEQTILVPEHVAQGATCSGTRKERNKYHVAAGESGFHRVKRPISMLTA